MKIESTVKLDFRDVLIRPKRSKLSSRSQVKLEREIKFPNSGQKWTGIPIITSNMDTIGTFEMYNILSKYKMITCFHKHYDIEDYPSNLNRDFYMISTGISNRDFEKLRLIVEKINPKFICIDVANGYMHELTTFAKKVRQAYPDKIITCGNVVTREMVEELILNCGVDIVKVGIGSGCFAGNTQILMANGTYKNICDIEKGDKVINKYGNPVSVLRRINKGFRNVIKMRHSNWDGETIVTPDHNYWINDSSSEGWAEIGTLSENQLLLMPNKTSGSMVQSREKINEKVQVWDIEVDCESHSFIANNAIVHNSCCTTRLQTGVGMPQLSAVIECSDAAHGVNGCIISDGGVKNAGDVSKALGGGADFVMLGSMLAGYDESGGDIVEENGKKYKIFYGMSSSTAMDKYHGGVAKYRSSEGKTVKILYKGPVEYKIQDILGGVRSTCTYIGASTLKQIPKCTTFMKVNQQVNTIYNGKEV